MNITPEIYRQRLKLVPISLQDAVFDAQTADLINRIGEKNHLSFEKIGLLAEVVGHVLVGFTHIEDAAQEIAERVQIPKELAATLAGELVTKLFAPLRGDIERSYAPPGHDPASARPSFLEEVRFPKREDKPDLYPQPASPPGMKFSVAPPQSPFQNIQNEAKTKAAEAQEKITSTADSATSGSTAAFSQGKISPLSYTSGMRGGEPSAAGSKTPVAPAPRIIHEEQRAAALTNVPRLGLGLGDDKLGSIGEKKSEASAAKFEISGLSKEQMDRMEREPLPSFFRKEIPSPHVVNYQPPVSAQSPGGTPQTPSPSPNFPITAPTPRAPEGLTRPSTKPEGAPTGGSASSIKPPLAAPALPSLGTPKISPSTTPTSIMPPEKIPEKKEPPPTPLQVFQAKKVDYKEVVPPPPAPPRSSVATPPTGRISPVSSSAALPKSPAPPGVMPSSTPAVPKPPVAPASPIKKEEVHSPSVAAKPASSVMPSAPTPAASSSFWGRLWGKKNSRAATSSKSSFQSVASPTINEIRPPTGTNGKPPTPKTPKNQIAANVPTKASTTTPPERFSVLPDLPPTPPTPPTPPPQSAGH